jgi:hypothetical protein
VAADLLGRHGDAVEGDLAIVLSGHRLNVLGDGVEHGDAAGVMVADVQHDGRHVPAADPAGGVVLGGQRVEPAARVGGDAVLADDLGEHRDHAGSLHPQLDVLRLAVLAVHLVVGGQALGGGDERLAAGEGEGDLGGHAVVADVLERHQAGAAGAV